MRKRVLFVLSVYVFWVVVFVLLKSAFTLVHSSMMGGVSVSEFFAVLSHGLKLDMSMSGYLTAIPLLLTIASLWIKPLLVKNILIPYFGIIGFLVSLIFVIDAAVYPYWGFHIDSSIFLYASSPKEALASASIREIIFGLVSIVVLTVIIFYTAKKLLCSQIGKLDKVKAEKTIKPSIALVLLGGLLFLSIRGGVTASTMNVGKVYFSDIMYLNHAAINPVFNLFYSIKKTEKFEEQYQFFEREKATKIFEELTFHSSDKPNYLLRTDKPNIILVLLESFSAEAVFEADVAPNFTKIAKEGINFTNFYANSFRTDRALVSILSGYPAHPTVALMKYPAKTQTLAAIPKNLVENGYSSSFYYGGDVDFANMRSYIIGACATKNIFRDLDFPVKTLISKWGAADEFVFDKVFEDISSDKYKEPFITTLLTLSSHEPFDVPMDRVFDDPYLNSVHYTDKCIGSFMEKLKSSKYWDNTLVVFLADHCLQSIPEGASSYDARRFHIPLVWSGGAIKGAEVIDVFGSQNDLAATLLGQLGIDYSAYKFSNDMLNSNEPKYAFYSYNNGFSMLDSSGVVVYDNDAKRVMAHEGEGLEEKSKSFFQMMYLDLGER